MPHFAVWIPDSNLPHADRLRGVGLSALATGFDVLPRTHGDVAGQLYIWRRQGRPAADIAAGQWIPAVSQDGQPAGRYQINVGECSPLDLLRNTTLPGRFVVLGDGNPWLIPVVERLPLALSLNDDGSLHWEPVRIYQGLRVDVEYMQQVNRWTNLVQNSDEHTEVDWLELWQFALRTLLVNYRITPEVVSALQLFDTDNLREILLVAVGAHDAYTHLRGLKQPLETAT